MTENKILKLEFSARSEAAGKLTEQQSECLDHEIQINPQPTESYEIQWNLSLRKPHRACAAASLKTANDIGRERHRTPTLRA
jgi:hypothetical protein